MSIIRIGELTEEYKSEYKYIKYRIMVVKESERYDAYSKESTADFENAVNITANISSIIPQEKQSGNKNNRDEINKTKKKYTRKQKGNTIKYIEKIAREKNPSKYIYLHKSYPNNIPSTSLMYTLIVEYPSKQLMTDKPSNNNRTRMKHVSLSDITKGYEKIAISISR